MFTRCHKKDHHVFCFVLFFSSAWPNEVHTSSFFFSHLLSPHRRLIVPFHLPTYFLHLAGLNHQTHTHLFLLRALHPLPAVPYSYFTLSVTLSHLFSPASGEHELWKDNRQVMGEVCVCNMWGRPCPSAWVHICLDDKGSCTSLSKKKKKNPIWKYFRKSFWFCTHTELTPTKPLTLKSLSCPTSAAETSLYAPIHHDIRNILCISKTDKCALWQQSSLCKSRIRDSSTAASICLGLNSSWNQTRMIFLSILYKPRTVIQIQLQNNFKWNSWLLLILLLHFLVQL